MLACRLADTTALQKNYFFTLLFRTRSRIGDYNAHIPWSFRRRPFFAF